MAQPGGGAAGLRRDICYDSASLYGTADAGVLGNETPLSICIRRFLSGQPELARQLFGESRLPTLVQYDPRGRYFESIPDGNADRHTLLFTGDNGVPLIRYHIADHGGIVGYDEMLKFLAHAGFDPVKQLGGHGWRGHRRMPFAFVFGRSHFTVSFFGANIYPENISVGLEQPQIRDWVTGKFVLQAGGGAEGGRASGARGGAGAEGGRRRGEALGHRRVDPGGAGAAQQRVQELRAGGVSAAEGDAACGRRSRVVSGGGEASLYAAVTLKK